MRGESRLLLKSKERCRRTKAQRLLTRTRSVDTELHSDGLAASAKQVCAASTLRLHERGRATVVAFQRHGGGLLLCLKHPYRDTVTGLGAAIAMKVPGAEAKRLRLFAKSASGFEELAPDTALASLGSPGETLTTFVSGLSWDASELPSTHEPCAERFQKRGQH